MAGFVCEERLTYGPWPAFERMVARLVQHAGFTDVAIVGGSGDLGADVVGAFNGARWVFQAKYRLNGGTDAAGVNEAALALGKYDGKIAVLATNAYFYENAYTAQREKTTAGMDMRLWNGEYSGECVKWTQSTRQKEAEFKVATCQLFMPLPVAAL